MYTPGCGPYPDYALLLKEIKNLADKIDALEVRVKALENPPA